MGVNASSLPRNSNSLIPLTRPKLDDIPESCIALVLSYMDPPEIAKLALLNRAFRAASSADFIWVPKLPSTYPYLLAILPDLGNGNMDIYARLCRPNPFDGGTKEVWIDKMTGGVCLAISSKAMGITGIDDRRYWNYIPTDESRFQTVAYLQQIWWLEVDGELEFKFPKGTYSLFFRLQLGKVGKRMGRRRVQIWWLEVDGEIEFKFPKGTYSLFFRLQLGKVGKRMGRRRVSNSVNVHGWDLKPAHFKLTMADGQHIVSQCMLGNLGNWVHYHVGDFVVEDDSILTKIKFSLTQIDCTHTKGGLCVDSVLICPISLGKELVSVDGEVCKKL